MPIAALLTRLGRLARDQRGSMAIEMAILAPVLILLGLGSADLGRMISRQHELQAGIAEAEAIVLAANAGASTDTNAVQSILMDSLNLSSSQVTVVKQYRCNANSTVVSSASSCGTNDVISTYIKITLTDSYNPFWTRIGAVGTWNYSVVRTVQLS